MTYDDHPPQVQLAGEAPLARAAVWAAATGVVLGFTFLPQVLGLALAGLSLVREPAGRRLAWLAVVASLVLVVVWGIVLGLVLKWWAASQTGS